jgi:hypothetical protein
MLLFRSGKSTSLDPLPPRRFKRKNEWGTGVGIAGISTMMGKKKPHLLHVIADGSA